MSAPVSSEATLDNLVAQFARPMDCLRELVQNAMDAGTPRVDVWLAYANGVLEIHVDDAGSGMDETIIDEQLTKLFSSTKEGDRTKIGKFGIGFSSIFAIQPDAVLLRTGRHGQNWELVFHPDRSYDKARIDEPVQGTKITLYKRMAEAEVPAVVSEARDVLAYWCEHAHTPITFADHTVEVVEAAPDSSDPFAAFASPTAGPELESISGPLTLDAAVQVRFERDGIEAIVGVGNDGPGPYAFYNGGLTLVSSRTPEVLAAHVPSLGHLSFKVRCDQLEHTLTRDNVLHDETFERVAVSLQEARTELLHAALDALEGGVGSQDRLMDFLMAEHAVAQAPPVRSDAVAFADHAGERWTLQEAMDQAHRLQFVLVEGPLDDDLDRALVQRGIRRLPDRPWVRRFADGWGARRELLGTSAMPVRRPRQVFVQPDTREAVGEAEEALFRAARRLLHLATGDRLSLRLGAFDEGMSEPEMAVAGPRGGGLFLRRATGWGWVTETLGWRQLVVNTVHPFFRSQVLAAERDPVLAAHGLLLALLHGDVFASTLRDLTHAALVEVRR